jgi:hypothetical protein
MKKIIKQITTKQDAEELIKNASLILYILVGLKLLAMLVTGYYKFGSILLETILITLLRYYRSRVSALVLIIMFLFPIANQIQNLFAPERRLDILIEYLIRIFLSLRSLEAGLKLHGLGITIAPERLRFAYKVYAWLLTIAFGYSSIETFISNQMKTYDYIDLPFTIFGLVGLFGFVYKRAILNPFIWRLAFIVIIFWDAVYSIFLYDYQTDTDLGLGFKLGAVFFITVVLAPYYVALYLYGYRSEGIWNTKT